MKDYKNIAEALEQLEKCIFTDDIGHPLENNTAFIYLKELSNKSFTKLSKEEISKAWGLIYVAQYVENWDTQFGQWDNVPKEIQQKYLAI